MQGKIRFLLKFLILIPILLLLWLKVGETYLGWLAAEAGFLLRLGGYTILSTGAEGSQVIFRLDAMYAVKFVAIFSTLNLMVFLTLVLATPAMALGRRLFSLAAGSAILHGIQVGFLVAVFYLNFNYEPTSTVTQNFFRVSEIGHLVLPFLLWAIFERKRIFSRSSAPQRPGADRPQPAPQPEDS